MSASTTCVAQLCSQEAPVARMPAAGASWLQIWVKIFTTFVVAALVAWWLG